MMRRAILAASTRRLAFILPPCRSALKILWTASSRPLWVRARRQSKMPTSKPRRAVQSN